jgi:predicted acyl esterase
VIDLGDLAHDLAPGHRLRLEVAASSYPQFLPQQASERTLLAGGPNGSALELSVLKSRSTSTRRSEEPR